MTEALVIGLDAATWRVLDPLIESGELPNITALIDDGVRGSLSTTTPPMTPLAWTSMATGTNPGRHGIFDFLEQDKETGDISPTDFSKMDTPAFWDVFASEGRTVGVVNFPLAHPPREIDAFFVGGIPAHERQKIAYPDKVQAYLEEIDYLVHPHVDPEIDPDRFYHAVRDLTETQVEATINLAERHDPELLWTVLMGIDWVQHHFWGRTIDGEDALAEFHRYIDEVVGRLVDVVSDDGHIILVSDHGARLVDGVIHLNSLLEDLGYLERQQPDQGIGARVRNHVLSVGWDIAVRLPPGVKRLLKRRVSNDVQEGMKAAVGAGQSRLDEEIDWAESKAYSYGYMGRVFVNSDEHTSIGPVPRRDIEQLREDIREDLLSVTHPETGESIFETVLTREEVYSGGKIDESADLIAVPENWKHSVFGDFGEEWIHPPEHRIADHDGGGIFVFSGPGVSGNIGAIDITEVVPTLLHTCGLPIVDSMDGDIREDLLSEAFKESLDHRTVSTVPVTLPKQDIAQENERDVEERLEELGYM